jgi:two-component system nitrogen regulation sensor histidine kinase GlnL
MIAKNLHTEILDNLKTAILLVDSDLSVSYINSAAEALLEVSGSRIIGEPITELFTEKETDQASLLQAINSISAFTKRETQIQLPSGHYITVDCAVTPIAEDDSNSSLVMELQPLDRLLRISREEGLLSSQQNSQALVRGLAHEIKNPLGGLRGAAQLLAKQLPDESLNDYTNIIIEEADRLSNLVNRMMGSHDLLKLQVLNIHEVLERVKGLVDAETGGNITILRDYDPSIPDIEGDKERLIQAVLNIVRNAMYSLQQSRQSKPLNITLKTRALRQFTIGSDRHRLACQIEITDNGPGIPEHIRETIFLPMVSGRADGTGLGLSIAQSIINHHKGLIECHSEPGNTVFVLSIPITATITTTPI